MRLRVLRTAVTAVATCSLAFSLAACEEVTQSEEATPRADATQPQESLSISQLTAADIPADGTVSALTGVVKDTQLATLSTARLSGPSSELYEYAHDVYVASCLVQQGLPASPVKSFDWNSPQHVLGANGYGLPDTPEEAAEKGFHTLRNEYGQWIDAKLADIDSRGEAHRAAWEACREQADADSLFQHDDDLQGRAPFATSGLANDTLKEAAEQWRTCMKPLGVPDLSDGEPEIPSSLLERFGVNTGEGLDSETISQEEIDTAVHVARCYEESHYAEYVYGFNWVVQEKYLMEHEAEYRALLAKIEKREQEYKDYINANRHVIG